MKRWPGVLLYALYLVCLSSVFVPLSHASWSQFAKGCCIRLAIALIFAVASFRLLNLESVNAYRITPGPSQPATENDFAQAASENPIEAQYMQPRLIANRRSLILAFWIAIVAICCIIQTPWWHHQAWIGRLIDMAMQSIMAVLCFGCLLLFWLPKPDASQPEVLHIVP